MPFDLPDLSPEFQFRTSRSGGPGGQHANKADTKVQLVFPLTDSKLLSQDQKRRALKKLQHRLTKQGELIVERGDQRSQKRNKEAAITALYRILRASLKRPRPRKRTKRPKRAEEERIQKKKEKGEKKRMRKPPDLGRDH